MTSENRPGRLLPLWFGILGPPLFWALRISASYVMVPFVCDFGGVLILHALTGAGLAGTTAAGLVAYRAWRDADAPDAREERARFMGLLGVLSAGFFFAVIVAESLANFLVDPCLTAGAPL